MPEPVNEIEQKVIDQFLDDESTSNDTTEGGESDDANKESKPDDSGQNAANEQEGQNDVQGDKGDGSGSNDGEKPQEGEGEKPEEADGDDTPARKPRDLVDLQTGEVIAKAGKERRDYENYAINNFHRLARKYQELNTEHEQVKKTPTVGTELNLTHEQVQAGAQLMAQLRDNPKQAIAAIVQDAKTKNIDLADLGLNVQTNDLKSLLEDYLGPIKKNTETSEERQQVINNARREAEEFFTKHPDAVLHEETLAGMITQAGQAGVNLSATDAYIALQKWAGSKGIDLSKPIAPQVEAIKAQSGNDQNGDSGSKKTTSKKPLPTGGRGSKTEALEASKGDPDENASYKDIIRQSMQEAGMNVNL